VVCDLAFKTLGNFAYVFLLLGLVDLAISIWIPEELLTSTLSLRIQITSLQGALILSVLAILKRPLPMLFAEAFAPDLKELHKQHAKQYVWIWQKISIVWILANLAKAALYQIDFSSEQLFSTVNLLTSWPLGIALVYFAIAYGRREFEKAGWET
jgi:hypothetical protein